MPPVLRFCPIRPPFRDRHFLGRLSGERMRIAWLAIIVFGFAPCLAVPATGQICAGSTSFAGGPLQVSGSAEVTTHAHGFGVGLTLGGTATFFGVSLGTTHFDALNGSSFDVAAGGGYELPLDRRGGIQLCPVMTVGHRSGPNNTTYGEYSETDVVALLRLGDVAMQSRRVRLIPTVGLGLEHAQQNFSRFEGPSATTSHGFGVLALGVGVVFGKAVTVLPEALVPIGLANGSAAFGLGLAAKFGR